MTSSTCHAFQKNGGKFFPPTVVQRAYAQTKVITTVTTIISHSITHRVHFVNIIFKKYRNRRINVSNAIILSQEIGSVPIHNLSFGFLFGMDIELVKNHHHPVLPIIERPILRLAIRRNIRTK